MKCLDALLGCLRRPCLPLFWGPTSHRLGRMQVHLDRQSAIWSLELCWWLPFIFPDTLGQHAPEWLCRSWLGMHTLQLWTVSVERLKQHAQHADVIQHTNDTSLANAPDALTLSCRWEA